MKNIFTKVLIIVLAVLLIPLGVNAAGRTTINVSNEHPNVGDKFTVIISATESGDMKLSYNASVITMVGSTVDGQTGSGSFSFNGRGGTFTFSADAPGKSGIIIASSSLEGSSMNIEVAGTAGANTEREITRALEEAPLETEDAGAGAPGIQVDVITGDVNNSVPEGSDFGINGVGYVVSERYSDAEIPAGFSEVTLNINGKTVRELTNGVFTLVYLKPADNTQGSGEFYIYDKDTGEISDFTLFGDPKSYIIQRPGETLFTPSLVPAEISIGDNTYSVYTVEGSGSDFYYVYGTVGDGNNTWFSYDSITGDISRADTASLALIGALQSGEISEGTENKESSWPFPFSPMIMIIIGIVFAAVLVILIVVSTAIRRKKRESDEDYYDDFDDEDDYKDGDYEEKSSIFRRKKEQEPVIETVKPEEKIYNPKTEAIDAGEKEEEVLEEIIKKASKDVSVNIMDLDDL